MSELLKRRRALWRLRHYSYKTEKLYIYWMKQYFYFHKLRHPKEMGAVEIEAFLTHLAVERSVAASTAESGSFGAFVSLPEGFENRSAALSKPSAF